MDHPERERYGKLVEEGGEVGQAIGKLVVYGREPVAGGIKYNNVGNLEKELGQFFAVVDMLVMAGDINRASIEIARADKLALLPTTLNHQSPELAAAMYLEAKSIWAKQL